MNVQPIISAFSIIISIAAIVISYKIYRHNRKLGIKPVLVFLRRSSKDWELANVGSGAALGIMVGEMEWETKVWSRFTNCYPIRAGFQLDLSWLNAIALGVVYEDVDGRKYTTTCQYDRNTISEGNRLAVEWPAPDDGRVVNEFDRRQGRQQRHEADRVPLGPLPLILGVLPTSELNLERHRGPGHGGREGSQEVKTTKVRTIEAKSG